MLYLNRDFISFGCVWGRRRRSFDCSGGITRSIRVWIRNTCGAIRSIRKKARRWVWASGTKCVSGSPWTIFSRMLIPRGSLRANVANATVRNLSNLPLHEMLESRHAMSRTVRGEVSPKAEEWGYQLGSVYVRKVHFRDNLMIRQIEQKVVNRLRQVTSAIRQAGTNQVDIVTSSAERQAATEFAKARSVRPQMIGQALREIGQDPDVLNAVFATLEVERLIKANAEITLIPDQTSETLVSLLAAQGRSQAVKEASSQ